MISILPFDLVLTFKSNMAAVSHLENQFFNVLAYSADQHMLSGVFRVEEFIFDVSFIIRLHFGLQIQDGRRRRPS